GVLVMGKYVPALRGLGMLLGNEPALEPAAQFYQRMLSRESEHLLDLASRYIAEHSLEEFYEAVFLPALQLAEEDRHNGALADERQEFIAESGRDLIEELERGDDRRAEETARTSGPPILGFAARDDADELVARMLAHLLRRSGHEVDVVPRGTDLAHVFEHVRENETPVVFVSALPPSALLAARQMCRRLRGHRPDLTVLVGVWSPMADVEELARRLGPGPAVSVATSLKAAVEQLTRIPQPKPADWVASAAK
ncbi:MAG TPA: cobalamin B12-binding domain-containing protein, partial [Candidatus Didemnitutus sp.]|nr:cobalamin B12-binding domain-containing protein [Candidatus Didemnitutus sp.]